MSFLFPRPLEHPPCADRRRAGWPTAGGKYGEAVPSVDNAQTFWKEGICFLRTWGIDIFAFEAFDEPNKPVSKGENGESKDERHWGMYSATREPKYDLSC